MSNEAGCPECAKVRRLLDAVTRERDILKRQITGRAPKEDVLDPIKEQLQGLQFSVQSLGEAIDLIVQRLTALETGQTQLVAAANPWDGIQAGRLADAAWDEAMKEQK